MSFVFLHPVYWHCYLIIGSDQRSSRHRRHRCRPASMRSNSQEEPIGSQNDLEDPDDEIDLFNGDAHEFDDEYSDSESDDDFDEYNDASFDGDTDVDDLEIIDDSFEPDDVENHGDLISTPNGTSGVDNTHDEYRQRSISSTSTDAGFLLTSEAISGSDTHSVTCFDSSSSAPIFDGNQLQTTKPGKLRRISRDKNRNKQLCSDDSDEGASANLPTPPTTGRSDKTYSHGTHDETSEQARYDRDLESDRSQVDSHRNQVPHFPKRDLSAGADDDIIFSGGLDRILPVHNAHVAIPSIEPLDKSRVGTGSATTCSVASAVEDFPNHQGRASFDNRPMSLSEKAKGKKRKASQPPPKERSSIRLSLEGTVECIQPSTFHGLVDDQVHSSITVGESSMSGHLQSVRIARNSTHPGCIAGQPCCHPLVGEYTASDPSVIIYHNTLHTKRQTTIAEVEYILSQCNCHWASFFGLMWDSWCSQAGGDQYASLAELLLHPTWHDDELREAAADCCPRGERVVICLDDD